MNGENHYYITYHGYGKAFDEWVTAARMSVPSSTNQPDPFPTKSAQHANEDQNQGTSSEQ